ncbi:MAG: metalloregulator ArsR/SmtB family transcription factor [bacterium]|nr:metalloregulator ArsR/SmtB family transcription factor [bacterium]
MDTAYQFRDHLNREFARIGKALASHKRLEILELLHQCPKSVDTLADNTGMSPANTSQHLQILRGAGLVQSSRDGTYIIYRLTSELVYDLLRMLRQVAETHLAEVDRALQKLHENPQALEKVDRDQLADMVRAGKVILLDVRPADEYAAAHLPREISIPLDQLELHLDRLPRDQQIVAYCRTPYCLISNMAVSLLRRKGFTAAVLGEGVSEWQEHGQDVESMLEH